MKHVERQAGFKKAPSPLTKTAGQDSRQRQLSANAKTGEGKALELRFGVGAHGEHAEEIGRMVPRRALLRAAAEPVGELDAGRLRLHALRRPPADSVGSVHRCELWGDSRA